MDISTLAFPREILAIIFSQIGLYCICVHLIQLDYITFFRLERLSKQIRNSIIQQVEGSTTLDFTLCKTTLKQILPHLLKKFQRASIKIIEASGCYQLNDSMLIQICTQCGHSLRYLTIRNCSNIKSLEFLLLVFNATYSAYF